MTECLVLTHITIGRTYFRASEEDTVKITESISDA